DAAPDGGGIEVDAGAERLQHVRRARQARRRAVAVLGHLAAGARGDDRRRRGDVERGPPAAGADDVEQLAVARDVLMRRQLAHRAREARDLLDRLALRAQADQEGGDLHLARIARHDLGEHRGGGVLGQVLAGGQAVDRAREQVAHAIPPTAARVPAARKLRSRSWPAGVRTDSGWNWIPSAGSVRCRSAWTTPPPRALTSISAGSEASSATS